MYNHIKENKDMKKHIINRSLTVVALVLLTIQATAQSASTGYFLEGYNQRYQLNPALTPERHVFVAFPVLSNLQFNLNSTFGASNFLYESTSKPGMLTTFMSSDIDAQEFLDAFPKAAQLNLGMNMDIISLGFGTGNWFSGLNVKLHNSERISLPKELFGFMKAGLSTGDYLIENTNINSITYIEYSLYHSHKIKENLTVGAALKLLQGLAYADVTIDEIDARLSEAEWLVKTNGAMNLSIPGMNYKFNEEDGTFDGLGDYSFSLPSSFGLAVDLGAVYDFKNLVKGLKVSAAVTDLGFINWGSVYEFATDNNEFVKFGGFDGYDAMGGDNEEVTEKIGEDMDEMLKLYQNNQGQKKSVGLEATIRLGAEYEMPFLNWLSFGELVTYRTGLWSYVESRTSICMSPLQWLDLTGNVCLTSMGNSMGLMLNLHPRGVNFFLAVDYLTAEFNKQFIPLNDFGANISLGFNFAFGDKR